MLCLPVLDGPEEAASDAALPDTAGLELQHGAGSTDEVAGDASGVEDEGPAQLAVQLLHLERNERDAAQVEETCSETQKWTDFEYFLLICL